MQKKIVLLICLLALLLIDVKAQKEANNWIFGDRAGLTWNTMRTYPSNKSFRVAGTGSLPTSLPSVMSDQASIKMRTYEGCFSLSDKDGNLLFYSDGRAIYDYKHNAIPGIPDLGGHPSSAQSGVLMPYPGRPDVYIILSIYVKGYKQLYYAVVDITGGRDNIKVESYKNPISGYSGDVGESLNVIQHSNRKDFWIVAPSYSGSQATLNSWLVTKDGVQASKPEKTISLTAPGNLLNTRYFKFSPNGKHFAWANVTTPCLFIGNFNSGTGEFSNIQTHIPRYPPDYGPTMSGKPLPIYGLEFSKSGNCLYVTGSVFIVGFDFNELMKNPAGYTGKYYELNIKDKESEMATVYPGSLQLGPDGYIYVSWYDFQYQPMDPVPSKMEGTRPHMLLITNPEQFNNLTIWRLEDFLGAGRGHLGITSFSPSWFEMKISGLDALCCEPSGGVSGQYTISLAGSTSERPTRLRWYWDKVRKPGTFDTQDIGSSGDPLPKSHTFPSVTTATKYTVEVEAYNGNTKLDALTQSMEVTIYPKPVATAEPIVVCQNSSAILIPTIVSDGATVTWYAQQAGGDPLPTTNPNMAETPKLSASTTYYMQIDNPACSAPDRIPVAVNVQDITVPAIIQSWPVCAGGNITMEVTGISEEAIVKWFDEEIDGNLLGTGVTYTAIDLKTTTTFYAEVTNSTCSNLTERLSTTAIVNPTPVLNTIIPPAAVCSGSMIRVTASAAGNNTIVRWYTSESSDTPDGTGNIFAPIEPLYSSTTFYAEAYNTVTGCASAKEPVDITVNSLPWIDLVALGTICSGQKAELSVITDNDVEITWYDVSEGGTALATGASYTTDMLTKDKTFYVEGRNTVTNCTTTSRIAINLVITPCGSDYIPVNPHLRSFYKSK